MSRNVGNRRVSGQQVEILWEFLNSHRDIALAFNRSLQAKEHSKRKWQEIAEILNAQGDGAHKDWKSWSRYWIDYKAKLKKRVVALRLSQQRTGGGPSTEQPLSDVENKFLQILGEDYGQGLSGVRVEPFPPAESTQPAEGTQPAAASTQPAMEIINFPFPDTNIHYQDNSPASESILASSSLQTFVVQQAPSTPPRTQTPPTAPPAPVEPAAVLSPRRRRRRREAPLTMQSTSRSLILSSERRAQAAVSSIQCLERIGNILSEMNESIIQIRSSLQQIERQVT